jgi:hypothetical protein
MYLVFTSSKRLLSAIILISIILFVLAIQFYFPQIISALENKPNKNTEGMTVNDVYDNIAKVLQDYSSSVNQKLDVVKALIPIIEDKAVAEQMKSIMFNSNLSDQDKITRVSEIVNMRGKATPTQQPVVTQVTNTQTIPTQLPVPSQSQQSSSPPPPPASPSPPPSLQPVVPNSVKPDVMPSQAR